MPPVSEPANRHARVHRQSDESKTREQGSPTGRTDSEPNQTVTERPGSAIANGNSPSAWPSGEPHAELSARRFVESAAGPLQLGSQLFDFGALSVRAVSNTESTTSATSGYTGGGLDDRPVKTKSPHMVSLMPLTTPTGHSPSALPATRWRVRTCTKPLPTKRGDGTPWHAARQCQHS